MRYHVYRALDNIINIFCFSQMPYLIISEFMNQGDLKFVLQSARLEGRTWPLKLKLLCALQTAEGLLYLNVEKW